MQCNTIKCNTIQYNTVQCNSMKCNTMQYSTKRKERKEHDTTWHESFFSLFYIFFLYLILEPPEIISKRKFHTNVGYKAEIKCISKGYPNPHFTWSWRDDNYTKKIQDGEEDERFKVVTRHTNVTSESVLIIQRITRADWRTYTCSAANKWGINSAELQLTGYSEYRCRSFVGYLVVFPGTSITLL